MKYTSRIQEDVKRDLSRGLVEVLETFKKKRPTSILREEEEVKASQ
jgi:hypothetical protein